MSFRSRIATFAGVAALLCGVTGPAQAAEVPSDLEYSVSVNDPVMGSPTISSQASCTQALGPGFVLALTGAVEEELTKAMNTPNNDIRCTFASTATTTGVTISGTVSASAQGQSGSGAFTLICESGHSMDSWFHVLLDSLAIPSLAPDPYGVITNGYISCNWTIDVADAQKSQLSGTLELQGSFSDQSTPVDWSNCASLGFPIPPSALSRSKCVVFDMNVKAYLTGATGAYAGLSGEGSMTQQVYAPVVIPISLDAPNVPPCSDENPCPDLTACEYSPTQQSGPEWLDLSIIPPYAGIQFPGWKGQGWYKCGGGGGDDTGLTGCEFSPTEQTGQGWSYIEVPPGASVPGYQGPGWYKCGGDDGGGGGGDDGGGGGGSLDLTACEYSLTAPADPVGWYDLSMVPPGTPIPGFKGPGWYKCPMPSSASISPQMLRSAFTSMISPRGMGDLLTLKTQAGKTMSPRFVAPAQTTAQSTTRDFKLSSATTVRLSTVPGATCTVTAKAGKATTTLVKNARALKGQIDTKVTAAKLMATLKAATGSTATLTSACSTKVGKKVTRLPAGSATVKFVP